MEVPVPVSVSLEFCLPVFLYVYDVKIHYWSMNDTLQAQKQKTHFGNTFGFLISGLYQVANQ